MAVVYSAGMRKTIITKDEHLHVRIDANEKRIVERAANKEGKRLSDYVRDSAMKRALGLLIENKQPAA